MIDSDEGWKEPQIILVILAHPDDPEFFCGATIARWVSQGHKVQYFLFTRGEKGSHDLEVRPEDLGKLREIEQKSAAASLGVSSVNFMEYSDGCLVPDLDIRCEVTRIIRQFKPSIVVTSDPRNIFPKMGTINHPDHRAAGQIVVDAVFPGVGNPKYCPELLESGLIPHSINEVWLSIPDEANFVIDVTDFWEAKINALHEHRSQIGDEKSFDERMRSRKTAESTSENPRYEEKFYRIKYR